MIPERRAVNAYLPSYQAANWQRKVCGRLAGLRNDRKPGELPEWIQSHYFGEVKEARIIKAEDQEGER